MIAAIVLYFLGMPLGNLVCAAALNADKNKTRASLGLPPLEHSDADKFILGLLTIGWPFIGAVGLAGILFNNPGKKAAR